MSDPSRFLLDAVDSAPDEVRADWRAYLTTAVEGMWQRPAVSLRNRSLLTVAAVTALGGPSELRSQIRAALENGVSRLELCEVMMQVGGYAGIVLAREGMLALKEVFAEQPEAATPAAASPEVAPGPAEVWPDDRRERAHAAYRVRHGARSDKIFAALRPYESGGSFDPAQAHWRAWIMETSFADLWPRAALSFQDRARVTVAILVVGGRKYELAAHIRGGLNLGISSIEMGESIMALAPYVGFPATVEAMSTLNEVLAEASAEAATADATEVLAEASPEPD